MTLTIGVWFLVQNGYYWHAYSFMQCMEAIIYHVAAGRIDKDLLQRIIDCLMANEEQPEDLKLEIIHAIDISRQELMSDFSFHQPFHQPFLIGQIFFHWPQYIGSVRFGYILPELN